MAEYDQERRCVRRVAPFNIKAFVLHNAEEAGEIFNLSEAGAGIFTYTVFPARQKVNLYFLLPENLQSEELLPIYAIGEVVWQKDADNNFKGLRHKTGIKFELILPEHQAIIREFIASIPEQKPTN